MPRQWDEKSEVAPQKMRNLATTVTPDEAMQAQRLAVKRGTTISGLIRELLLIELRRFKFEEEE